MKALRSWSFALLAVVLLLQLARAQVTPSKNDAPKPTLSSFQYLLLSWNDVGRKLIAMAEDFPEDKYDFRPAATQRTFAEQLLHAAEGNYYIINLAKGGKPQAFEPKQPTNKSKAIVIAYLKHSFEDGATLIKSKGENGLGDLLLDPYVGQPIHFSDEVWGYIEHSGEHYGQLVVYYRAAGLVPPESRPKK